MRGSYSKKTHAKWLKRIRNTRKPFTEGEVRYLKKFLNGISPDDVPAYTTAMSIYRLTPEQTSKGIAYLRNVAFKKNGQPRNTRSMPFGYRERDIILNFKRFEFLGYVSQNDFCHTLYAPIYRVHSTTGGIYFDYVAGTMGDIEVIG